MKSIQMKLTAVILAVFSIAMSVLGGLNYSKAKDIMTETITTDIQVMAKNSAGELGNCLEARKTELIMLASNPVMVSGNPEAIIATLAAAEKSNKVYDALAFADPSGDSWASNGAKVNVADRPFFEHAMQGKSFVADPSISKGTGHLISVVAVPVKAEGKIAGVLFGPVSMEEFGKRVRDIKVAQTGYAYVVQADGLAIAHQDPEIAMKVNLLTDTRFPADLRKLCENIVKNGTGVSSYEYDGVKKYLSFAPISGVTWFLAVNVPQAEVYGPLATLKSISIVTTITVLIITAIIVAWYARRIARPIRKLEIAAKRIATGDLTQIELSINSKDEIGRLSQSFEQMTRNLLGLLRQIRGATEQVAASAQELTASSEQSAHAASQIATSIIQVASGTNEQVLASADTTTAVDQISAGIQQIAANASQVSAHSSQAAEKAENGAKAVETVATQMEKIQATVNASAAVVTKLGERSKEIGQIVYTIAGIAGQTNLLALNAAIEAARAGDQGRGFAVVAEEVRKLAEQSEEAAKRIAGLIGEVRVDTENAVAAMDNGTQEVKNGAEVVNATGAAFQEIVALVAGVSNKVKEMSTALQKMALDSQRIVDSVRKIDALGKASAGEAQGVSAAAQEQLASMEEIASSSQALAKLAEDLQEAVAAFQV